MRTLTQTRTHARTHTLGTCRTRWVRAACVRVHPCAYHCAFTSGWRGEAPSDQHRIRQSHSDAACCRMLSMPLSACRRPWCMLQGATACLHGLGERHVHADEVSNTLLHLGNYRVAVPVKPRVAVARCIRVSLRVAGPGKRESRDPRGADQHRGACCTLRR